MFASELSQFTLDRLIISHRIVEIQGEKGAYAFLEVRTTVAHN